MSGEVLLSIEGLSIAFRVAGGLRPAVNQVSLDIRRGEILGLVGESGSGKTLLSLAAMGLLPPNAIVTGGRVVFDGTDLLRAPAGAMRRLRGKRISMIFQDPMASLDPIFTCGSQLMEAILLHDRVNRRQAEARALELLDTVRIPDPRRCMQSYPHELSGGQCQRVMIAVAVACHPDVIIADEPTTALDVTVQKQVLALLRRLNHEIGAAILLITHDLGVIYEVADRVAVIYRGDVVEQAPAAELFRAPQSPYTRALIASVPSMTPPGERLPVIERAEDGTVRSAVRVPAQARRTAAAAAAASEPLLRLEQLVKTYTVPCGPFGNSRSFRAVDNVSLCIPPHTTLGLVGESGCGKSTLSRLVTRLAAPDSGHILFMGQDLATLPPAALRRARRDIALVFQNPYGSLNPRQTVADLIAAPVDIHDAGRRRTEVVQVLMDAVGLPRAAAAKYPHEFSGGQRQRIVIARALALRPRLVICDEAVSALDVSVQAQVLNLLQDLQAEFALTYLFISHDMSVVRHVSDTVAVMQNGRIVESGPAADVFAAPRDPYTRTLLGAVPRIGAAAALPAGAVP